MDDNQKRFIPPLAIDNAFFRSAFVNPCTMYNQRRSRSGVRLTAHLAIKSLMANYCITVDGVKSLKGPHRSIK